MPLTIGTKNIIGIYKGGKEIDKVYKGTTLLYSWSWEQWYQEYVYNTLIPTTINSKNVKSRAKVQTIYGNSVVENQLVDTNDTSITLGTHTYLTYISGTWSLITGISQTLSVDGGTDMVIDLTQMFPFDTPTTLTDTRVQALLNRGYTAFNTGTLKSVDMSEVSSEPYNLFDGELESGYISSSGVDTPHQAWLRAKNYIKVIQGRTYTWSESNFTNFVYCLIALYNANKDFIQRIDITNSRTNYVIPNGCCFIRILYSNNGVNYPSVPTNPQIAFHLTGTRTGYAPYQAPQTLSFKYQGSGVNTSHDTMTIGNENIVFTKEMAFVDLGTLDYSYISDGYFITTISPAIKTKLNNEVVNAVSSMYIAVSRNDFVGNPTDKTMRVDNNQNTPKMYFRNNAYTDATTFKTAMSGVPLEYQLANPQTITIPRKRLGVIDLGSLNWTASFVTSNLTYCLSPSNAARFSGDVIANIYCVRFLTDKMNNVGGVNSVLETIGMGYSAGANTIYIKSKLINSSTDTQEKIQQILSGILLFYETNDDVPDITNTIQIQAGGTITTNSDVLPNINFEVQCK